VLYENPNFDLQTVFWIDQVQKHKSISTKTINYLRKLGIIEGKKPNIYLSSKIAEIIDDKAQYIKNKGFDEEAYRQWIINYLKTYKEATKQDFVNLLSDKLPDSLDDIKKRAKVKNLLQKMKKEGAITVDSSNKRLAVWRLT